MPTTPSAEWTNEQLLGEIETRIVGRQYYRGSTAPGEQVSLEREPENPHDRRAIRVESGLCEARGDQAEVWADVDACLASTGVRSETHALTDSYTAAEERLRELRGHFPLPEGAAGLLVARRGKIVGMDLFDSPRTFGVLRDRLLDAYLLDALGDQRRGRKAKPEEARRFVRRVADAARPRVSRCRAAASCRPGRGPLRPRERRPRDDGGLLWRALSTECGLCYSGPSTPLGGASGRPAHLEARRADFRYGDGRVLETVPERDP